MEKIEILKTLCEIYKSFCLALLTALFAVLGYVAINLYSLKFWQFVLAGGGVFGLFVMLIVFVRLLVKSTNLLKKELK